MSENPSIEDLKIAQPDADTYNIIIMSSGVRQIFMMERFCESLVLTVNYFFALKLHHRCLTRSEYASEISTG